MNLKTNISKNYINFRGWKTNRKLIVIESDDWGSVRLKSAEILNEIKKRDSEVFNSKRENYDGLEKTEDMEMLFEVLSEFKDQNGQHPVITALTLTSNPDFDKIKNYNDKFYSELISDTYKNYGESKTFELWKNQGIKNNLLYPQFHGKEHLHPERYLQRIQDESDIEKFAFQNNSIFGKGSKNRNHDFMAAFEYHHEEDKKDIEKRTAEGLREFENLFGFKSKSFCPSQSVYGEHLFDVLKNNGVVAIQAGQQFRPENLSLKKVDHYWGDKTSNGLVFWRRNCTFETYKGNHIDHVGECLKEIEIAFRWGKPAVINSHRINYTSRINTSLRDITLNELSTLLRNILKKWPEVEFVNSSQLADIISKNS